MLRKVPILGIFLSTLSLRRATNSQQEIDNGHEISIHALLAESDVVGASQGADIEHISIHALLAESDCTTTITICTASKFLSTLSLRRATRRASRQQPEGDISIHALLAESDKKI